MKEKLLTVRDVSRIIGISEKDVIELANAGQLKHFRIAGEFLRFKKEDVLAAKASIQRKFNVSPEREKITDKLWNFIYFNDFYIISFAVIVFLLWAIFKK